MSQESFPGESSNTPWTPPLDPELDAQPVVPAKPTVDTIPLSRAALAGAGAGAVNLLFTVACAVAWLIDEKMGTAIIGASNGLWLLLGIVAIGIGAYIQRQQKQASVTGGTAGMIATMAILSGGLIMTIAVLLPMISAMRSIIAPGG